jgi:hypothetical protein
MKRDKVYISGPKAIALQYDRRSLCRTGQGRRRLRSE